MHILAIDLGHYSVKFLQSQVDKKNVNHYMQSEIVLDNDEQFHDINPQNLFFKQVEIIKSYLIENNINANVKIILNVPNSILTTRNLVIPIKNKKKALQMIPFQLEEDIPFSITEAHWGARLQVDKDVTNALLTVVKNNEFRPFYDLITGLNVLPSIVTSETSLFENFIQNANFNYGQHFCILDIGHHATKAYFFNGKKFVSGHLSYFGGRIYNNAISESYSINIEEAILYKHQNSFYLTPDQIAAADEKQLAFHQMMEQVISPFLQEFKRWELGYRIQQGIKISDIYVTGGTANIKNFGNYFSSSIGIRVSSFDSYHSVKSSSVENSPKSQRKFNLTNLMTLNYSFKQSLINLLNGPYAIHGSSQFPISTLSFITTRVAIVSLIFMISIFAEKMFINSDIATVNIKLQKVLKEPQLQLNPRQIRMVAQDPLSVHSALKRKSQYINQEVSVLQSALQINQLKIFTQLASLVSSMKVSISNFDLNETNEFTAIFTSEYVDDLKKLEKILNQSKFNNVFIELNEEKKTLSFSGYGE